MKKMASVADYLKDMDTAQLAVTASLALATAWGVNRLVRGGGGLTILLILIS
jgi:hypothetical protein